jgi:hypothetical protein
MEPNTEPQLENTENNKEYSKKSFLLLFSVIILIIVVFALSNLFQKNSDEQIAESEVGIASTHKEAIQEEYKQNETGKIPEQFYTMNIVMKNSYSPYFWDSDFTSMFGLKDGLSISPEVFYDSHFPYYDYSNNKYVYTGNFYLKIDKNNIKQLDFKKYVGNSFDATLSPIDPKIIPYINDMKYCEVDSDCHESGYFCGSGVFNYYKKQVSGFGCYDIDSSITEDEKNMCDLSSKHPELSYTNIRCVSNQCTSDRAVTCVAGAYQKPI